MTEDNAQAALFRKMADDIMHNADNGFGGAFVIIPPVGGGNPISVLLLDSANDAAMFWGLIGPKAQMALQELMDKTRNGSAGQAFRR